MAASTIPRSWYRFGPPLPLPITVSSSWHRGDKEGGREHWGLDLPTPIGTPVFTIGDGTVVRSDTNPNTNAGKWAAVQHEGGLISQYLHLDRVDVQFGQKVKKGQQLGLSGMTGARSPHLHIQLKLDPAMKTAWAKAFGTPRNGFGAVRTYHGGYGGIGVPAEPLIPVTTYVPRAIKGAAYWGIPLYADIQRRLAKRIHPAVWLLLGGALAGGSYYAWRLRRKKQLGLAPPRPGQREMEVAFDPWAPAARRKRAAQEFLDVRARTVKEVIPDELPGHIRPFAEYMRRTSKRPVSGRDIVKAYLLTVGSMQRSAISTKKIRERWKTFPGPKTGKARPEDVLGDLLRSDVGQRYLAAAARGRLDRRAVQTMARRFSSFGFENQFTKQLSLAPALAADAKRIDQLLKKGSRRSWYRYVDRNVLGVGLAKSGFFASLLGRGDMATADARELNFWLCPINKWDRERSACIIPLKMRFDTGDLVDLDFVEILNKKVRALKMEMPGKYKPFYEHLTHHAIWDAVGKTATPHTEIIEAMEEV